jgi:hypothetical protein
MLTVALGIFVITWFVGRFSKEGVAAYGIATRIEQIFLLPYHRLEHRHPLVDRTKQRRRPVRPHPPSLSAPR